MYYQTDHIGSLRTVTDATGSVIWQTEYSPFGILLLDEPVEGYEEFDVDYVFGGKFLDKETGLFYFNARYYCPATGRFISEDPIRSGLNWYVYCENNPLVNIDPNGKDCIHPAGSSYPGWSNDAPQRVFGYKDWMDNVTWIPPLFFDIHATKFEMSNGITLRLWKGSYWIWGGGGGEIGLYANNNGHSLDNVELYGMGLTGSSIAIYNKNDNSLVAEYTEKDISFWTTAFNEANNPGKANVYTISTLYFDTEEQATDFADNLKDVVKAAKDYSHNDNENIDITVDDNSVIIVWGIPEEVDK